MLLLQPFQVITVSEAYFFEVLGMLEEGMLVIHCSKCQAYRAWLLLVLAVSRSRSNAAPRSFSSFPCGKHFVNTIIFVCKLWHAVQNQPELPACSVPSSASRFNPKASLVFLDLELYFFQPFSEVVAVTGWCRQFRGRTNSFIEALGRRWCIRG